MMRAPRCRRHTDWPVCTLVGVVSIALLLVVGYCLLKALRWLP